MGGVHHAAQRAGPAVPLQCGRRRQDLQGGPRGPSARVVRHDGQESRTVLLGAPDALRQRERALYGRGAELAGSAHHDEACGARGGEIATRMEGVGGLPSRFVQSPDGKSAQGRHPHQYLAFRRPIERIARHFHRHPPSCGS